MLRPQPPHVTRGKCSMREGERNRPAVAAPRPFAGMFQLDNDAPRRISPNGQIRIVPRDERPARAHMHPGAASFQLVSGTPNNRKCHGGERRLPSDTGLLIRPWACLFR
jgi:hypothetical protein